jgi:hypothetical protein
MGISTWLNDNWFNLLQGLGIFGGLIFTAVSLRQDAKSRRVANLMAITQNHREIWSEIYQRPGLARVIDPSSSAEREPLSREEDLFIRFLILHLNSVYHALKEGLLIDLAGLRKDVRWFFSLPLPMAVWAKLQPVQDPDFVRFVQECLTMK